ncbi:hypothetical protein HK102_012723, partial [Quaeritorhiza haematococci]
DRSHALPPHHMPHHRHLHVRPRQHQPPRHPRDHHGRLHGQHDFDGPLVFVVGGIPVGEYYSVFSEAYFGGVY